MKIVFFVCFFFKLDVRGIAFICQEVLWPQHDRHIYVRPLPGLECTTAWLEDWCSNHWAIGVDYRDCVTKLYQVSLHTHLKYASDSSDYLRLSITYFSSIFQEHSRFSTRWMKRKRTCGREGYEENINFFWLTWPNAPTPKYLTKMAKDSNIFVNFC